MVGVIALAGMLVMLGVGAVLLIRGTIKKTDWGINVNANTCPTCGAALPRVRTPTSFRQAMWGGSTCAVCGTETDKWGRRR